MIDLECLLDTARPDVALYRVGEQVTYPNESRGYIMLHCEQVGCTGHLGKFDSCRDEALYELSLDSYGPTTGDVEYEGHYSLIDLNQDELVPVAGLWVTVLAGAYIVIENSQGFVDVETYGTTHEARDAFALVDEAYSAWLDDDEEV